MVQVNPLDRLMKTIEEIYKEGEKAGLPKGVVKNLIIEGMMIEFGFSLGQAIEVLEIIEDLLIKKQKTKEEVKNDEVGRSKRV